MQVEDLNGKDVFNSRIMYAKSIKHDVDKDATIYRLNL